MDSNRRASLSSLKSFSGHIVETDNARKDCQNGIKDLSSFKYKKNLQDLQLREEQFTKRSFLGKCWSFISTFSSKGSDHMDLKIKDISDEETMLGNGDLSQQIHWHENAAIDKVRSVFDTTGTLLQSAKKYKDQKAPNSSEPDLTYALNALESRLNNQTQ